MRTYFWDKIMKMLINVAQQGIDQQYNKFST